MYPQLLQIFEDGSNCSDQNTTVVSHHAHMPGSSAPTNDYIQTYKHGYVSSTVEPALEWDTFDTCRLVTLQILITVTVMSVFL